MLVRGLKIKDARSVVAAPEAPYGTAIEWDGTLVRRYGDPPSHLKIYNHSNRVMTVVPRPEHDIGRVGFALGDPPMLIGDLNPRQHLLDRYLPVVLTKAEHEGVALAISVFGWRADGRYVDLARIEASNTTDVPRRVPVWVGMLGQSRELNRLREYADPGDLGWSDGDLVLSNCLVLQADPPPDLTQQTFPSRENLAARLDSLYESLSHSTPQEILDAALRDFEAETARTGLECAGVFILDIAPNGQAVVDLTMPTPPAPIQSTTTPTTNLSYEDAREQCVAYWRSRCAQASQVRLPTKELTDLYKSSLVNILLLSKREDSRLVLCPGKAEYNRFWTRDASFMSWALDLAGLHETAQEALEYMVHLQETPKDRWAYAQLPSFSSYMPESRFDCPIGQWDGLGQAPWAMLEHYRLTDDQDWLAEVYPAMRRAAHWIRQARALIRERADSLVGLDPGLLPPGVGEGVNNEPDQYFVLQFWALHGLTATRIAATILGEEDDQAWLAEEEQDLRKAIQNALDGSFMESDGINWISATPTPWRDINVSMTRYYETFLHWPFPILDDQDPRVHKLFDSYKKRWLRDNLLAYRKHPEDGWAARELLHRRGWFQQADRWPPETDMRWIYGSTLIAIAYLMRGNGDDAAAIFEEFASRAHSTGNWVEHIALKTGRGIGDQPHGWAAACYIILTRLMLLREGSDTLEILSGIPRSWTAPGTRFEAMRMPTVFGSASLAFQSEAAPSGAELRLQVEVPSSRQLKALALHLRVPRGHGLRDVMWNNRVVTLHDNVVKVPAETGALRATMV